MQITSLSDLKAHLSEYADRAEREHERYTITRNGRASVVLVSADDWEALEETIFWLSVPGIRETIAEAENEIAAGNTADEAKVRAELGLPPRG